MFLAIDTVFEQCAVAVVDADLQVLSQDTQTGKRAQTEHILPMIDAALQRSGCELGQLTALIFNRGPGAFSGIRINTAVVQALSVAHDIPCVGVSSLAVLAQLAHDSYALNSVYVALDARMQQVYFAQYSLGALETLDTQQVMQLVTGTDERLLDYAMATELALPVLGNGAALLGLTEAQQRVIESYPAALTDKMNDAVTLAKLGVAHYLQAGGVPAEQALPVYLRHNAWKTLKEQGRA